jgi:hypothetical protein
MTLGQMPFSKTTIHFNHIQNTEQHSDENIFTRYAEHYVDCRRGDQTEPKSFESSFFLVTTPLTAVAKSLRRTKM